MCATVLSCAKVSHSCYGITSLTGQARDTGLSSCFIQTYIHKAWAANRTPVMYHVLLCIILLEYILVESLKKTDTTSFVH